MKTSIGNISIKITYLMKTKHFHQHSPAKTFVTKTFQTHHSQNVTLYLISVEKINLLISQK